MGTELYLPFILGKDVRIISLPLSRKPSLQGYSLSVPTHHRLLVKPWPRLASCYVHRHMGGLSLQKANSYSLGVRHELLKHYICVSSVQQVSEAGPFITPFYRGGHWGKEKWRKPRQPEARACPALNLSTSSSSLSIHRGDVHSQATKSPPLATHSYCSFSFCWK